MSSVKERRERATEEAATWLLQLESGPLSEEEQARLSDWLMESPLHVAELLHTSRMQGALKRFAERGLIQPLDQSIAASADTVTPLSFRRNLPEPRSRLQFMIPLAATLAAVAVIVTLSLRPSAALIVQTQLGERRELALADGSNITVGPSSELRISLGARERLVVLLQGEAFFHVAKDPSRPFVVDAGGARTQDIGTSFSVERRQDQVLVTVVEGRVDVSPAGQGKHFDTTGGGEVPVISLTKNEQVAISQAGVAAPVRKVNSEVESSWAQGQLIFNNTRIDDIARRFNQFNRVQIRIANDALASRLFTGVFRADDPRSFADMLVLEAVARVRLAGGGDIIIDASSTTPDSQATH